jgi:ABC-type uncharacterized transport system substrate-binding protein
MRWRHFIRASGKAGTSKVKMWRSNTAGRRVNTIDCRRLLPIWFAVKSTSSLRQGPPTRHSLPRAATATIPIVFSSGGDVIKLGLVASLARPGGNATGINLFTGEVVAKRLGLLHELAPKAARVAVLVNPANAPIAETTLRAVPEAARAIGLQTQVLNASTSREIEAAFAALVRDRADALFIAPDGFFNSRRVQFVTLATRDRMPTSCASREMAEAGLLMSYGTDILDMWRQVGAYTGQILKGANPADLPVLQSTKFEFVINLIAAKALGLTVPPTLLARADEVIE